MLLPRARNLAGSLAILLACGACASTTASKATAPSAATAAVEDPLAPLAPPDGKWLRDAEGREYFTQQLRLPPGSYTWLDPQQTSARVANGLDVDVVAHDDQQLTVKVYRADQDAPAAPRGPSDAERSTIAQSYRTVAKQGDGLRLVPFDDGLPRRGQWRNGFAIADVDGDGHADIVFAPPRKSRMQPVIFRGDGAGHWTVWQEARFPALPFDYGDAAVGDLDGDGHADAVLASHLRGIVATRGDGKGGFTAWSKGIEFALPGTKAPQAFTSRAITLADWNHDGRPDIVALGEGPHLAVARAGADVQKGSRGIVVYLNGGDGSWTKVANPGTGSFGNAVVVADVDGDGRLDIVTGSERRGFRGILNVGQADGSWREVEIAELRPGAINRAIALADFDGDGRLDIAVGYLSSEAEVERRGIDVLLNRGTSWERKPLLADEAAAAAAIGALATGDLDADGTSDLAAVDDRGRIIVFRGDGKGGFARAAIADPPANEACHGYGLRLANVDGAPGDEILAGFADESDEGLGGPNTCPSQGSLRVWKPALD